MDIVNILFNNLPKISTILIISTIATNVLVWAGIITPYFLHLNKDLIIKRFQIWRLFTNFLYLGKFNTSLILNIILLSRNSKQIEKKVFHGDSADYLYFLFFCMIIFIIISPLTKIIFFSHCLRNSIMYYWGRKCKRINAVFMGVIRFRACYLPFIYFIVSFLMGYNYKSIFYGIIVGHIYFYLKDILPRIKGTKGIRLLETPQFMRKFCNFLRLNNEYFIEVDNDNENIFI